MNVRKSAVIGAAAGAALGAMAVVPVLSVTVFFDVFKTCLAKSLTGRPDEPYIFNASLVPQNLVLKMVFLGAVLGSLVCIVCAVAANCFFSISNRGKANSN
jgi:hypothetical protein